MSRDVSVDHAGVVEEYRAAHEISDLNDRQQASTEQLRQAMVHYRALFTELLDDGGSSTGAPRAAAYDDSTSRRDDTHRDDLHRDDLHRDDLHRDDTAYADDTARRDDRPARDDATYAADGGTTRDPGYATDEDRRFEPVDTSRADGVRVERGGLGRDGTQSERDLPREERPRT
jgi:hypothetical protein